MDFHWSSYAIGCLTGGFIAFLTVIVNDWRPYKHPIERVRDRIEYEGYSTPEELRRHFEQAAGATTTLQGKVDGKTATQMILEEMERRRKDG